MGEKRLSFFYPLTRAEHELEGKRGQNKEGRRGRRERSLIDERRNVRLLKHTIVGQKIYNSELMMIEKSEIKYSDEIGLNPQRVRLSFIKRVGLVKLKPN